MYNDIAIDTYMYQRQCHVSFMSASYLCAFYRKLLHCLDAGRRSVASEPVQTCSCVLNCFFKAFPFPGGNTIDTRAVEPDFKKSNNKPDAKVGYRRLYPTLHSKAADVLAG